MLALLAPSGGMVHTPHDAVLKMLPQPKRFRLAIDASWAPGKELFSSCFMRPADLTAHLRQIRPDALVIEALQHFAQTSGRDLMVIVSADARGTSDISGKTTPADVDAVLSAAGGTGRHLRAAVRPGQPADPRHARASARSGSTASRGPSERG